MRTRTKVYGLAGLVAVLLALAALGSVLRHGISARDQPTAAEAFLAGGMRHLAIPRGAERLLNPVPDGPQMLAEAEAHFADHCASCHGDDGKGGTEIGRHLYPKAPDMTAAATQTLTDGEIFFIIKNGVRLTGMPAWGDDTPEADRDTWKLVRFIRYLPRITPQELDAMRALNPKSRADLEEEEADRRFLAGEDATSLHHHP